MMGVSCATADEPMGLASIVQILTGHALGSTVICGTCWDPLGAGDIVIIAARRPVECPYWELAGVYCWGCAPTDIETIDTDIAQTLLGGRLGTRSDPTSRVVQLCLTELAIVDTLG